MFMNPPLSMAVFVGGVVPGLVRLLVGVRVVVHRVPVAVFVAVDDDLTGGIALGAVAGRDLAGSPAFEAFFDAVGDLFFLHALLLCCVSSGRLSRRAV
jgi:hypothetical protein